MRQKTDMLPTIYNWKKQHWNSDTFGFTVFAAETSDSSSTLHSDLIQPNNLQPPNYMFHSISIF